jgi:type IV pilus assembly protein PilB
MQLNDATVEELVKDTVDQDTLEDLKQEAQSHDKPLQELLVERKEVSDKELTKLYGESIGTELVELNNYKIDTELLSHIPEHIARQYKAVLFEMDESNNHAKVAIADPGDLPAVDSLEKLLGTDIDIYIATDEDINKVLDQYKGNLDSEITKVVPETTTHNNEEEVGEEEVAEDSPVAKTVNLLIEYAVKENASDIHIEPREGLVQVRYRIDGVLQEANTLPKNLMAALVSRIKIMANIKIDEHRRAQDGRFKIQSGQGTIALRVSVLPIMDGEKIVMRLLDESARALTLQELGFNATALERMQRAMEQSHGMILVTGPTGAGKSTTLYSVLSGLNSPNVNISTVEDPVEYRIHGVNQTQVNPKAGMTFANGLRALLRQDPNIIMVGEIRDGETANLAVQAALTGHLVLSTLHTNNAATTLPRLLDMGAEPFLISSTVRVVVGQRLVRRLCGECRQSYQPEGEELEQIKQDFHVERALPHINENLKKFHQEIKQQQESQDQPGEQSPQDTPENQPKQDEQEETRETPAQSKTTTGEASQLLPPQELDIDNFTVYKAGEGCDACNGRGYSGRIGIYEVLEVDETISKMIVENATSDDIQTAAIDNGLMTMQLDGFMKCLKGDTSLQEVLRVTRE